MEIIFENRPRKLIPELLDVFAHRALVFSLTLRQLRIMYSQTILGIFWAFIRPIAALTIYCIFFSVIVPLDTDGMPYALVALTGLMGWNVFQYTIDQAGQSLIADADLVKKNAIPKLVIPLYRCLGSISEFTSAVIILLALQFIFKRPPQSPMLLLPAIYILNLAVGLSIGLWTSVLSVRVRDLFHLVVAITHVSIWLTPVFYGANLIPAELKFLLYINPMAGVIALYRWSALGLAAPSPYYLIGICIAGISLIYGLLIFVRLQHEVNDYL